MRVASISVGGSFLEQEKNPDFCRHMAYLSANSAQKEGIYSLGRGSLK